VCCNVLELLQCVAVCCNVLQCVAGCLMAGKIQSMLRGLKEIVMKILSYYKEMLGIPFKNWLYSKYTACVY